MLTSQQQNLAENSIKLVYKIASRWQNHPHYDDVVSEGNLALCRAAEGYDDKLSVKFTTYAYTCIYRAMIKYLMDEGCADIGIGMDIPDITTYSDNIIPNMELNEAIDRLPKNQSVTMRMILDGHTLTSIARGCKVTPQAVSQWYAAGQDKLYRLLGGTE
jgi:RNA polymerase sporulation-specific sigma factor